MNIILINIRTKKINNKKLIFKSILYIWYFFYIYKNIFKKSKYKKKLIL